MSAVRFRPWAPLQPFRFGVQLFANAAAGTQSLEEAADAYLAALVQKIGIRLLDERFKLPKGKEVFL